MARFTAAESRLYPLALVDPAGYERAVAATGRLLTELRTSCPDIGAVLAQREPLVESLAAASGERPAELGGLSPETVVDAACAVRCRELWARERARRAQHRVAAARAAGQEWLVEEPDADAVMTGEYRRVELHVPTGTALVGLVEAGGAQGTAYRLQVVPAPAADGTAPPEVSETYGDRASWVEALQRHREALSSRR
ncbi:MAG TPA: hypothetical protein VFK66_13210 [Oryzihumus sp.]|nr:hypothetical protein [Oryzihumus sp.]